MIGPRRPVAKRPLLVLLFAVILAACYGAPAAETIPAQAAPVASPPPVDGRPAGETAGPIMYPPDTMWAFLSTMPDLHRRAGTLAAAVDFAEVVVVGRYAGVERGARYGSDTTVVALIEVQSVVKGTPNLGPDGLLRVEFVIVNGPGGYPEKVFADLERSIPRDPALLYLFSWASYLDLIGDALPSWAGIDRADRYKTIGGDGAMRVVNGKIEPSPHVDGWPTELRGLGIEQVKDQIRAAIRPAGPPGSPAP